MLPDNISQIFQNELFLLFALSLLFATIVGLILRASKTNSIISKITHKTLIGNIWDEVVDCKNGCSIILTLNDGDSYIGQLYSISNDYLWIVLTSYIHYDSSSKIDYNYDDNSDESILMLKTENIKECRIFYDDDTPKSKEIKDRRL